MAYKNDDCTIRTPGNAAVTGKELTAERVLFGSRNLTVSDCRFTCGESPLKESDSVEVAHCTFGWKYPLWYCRNIRVHDSVWEEGARAGVWYTDGITVEQCRIDAPKNFRRTTHLTLDGVTFSNAAETLWNCRDVTVRQVKARGDYFAMGCDGMEIDGLELTGNYPFDGARNVVIRFSRLISKDAFWNSENITVYDSYISGEYLGWNAKNLTLIRCTVESLQGLCYIENLRMEDCRTERTTLALEYTTGDVEIRGGIDSILNPTACRIRADRIGTLTLDPTRIDPAQSQILSPDIAERKTVSEI